MTPKHLQLVLVRHGLTDWNEDGRLLGRIDIGLNARGRLQADAAAEAIRELPVASVVSSPQLRTRETAAPIAAAFGLEPRIDAGVDEVWLTAAWQGKTVSELRGDPELERTIADPLARSDAIEPIEEVQRRAVDSIERIREETSSGAVVIVSHGDPLRVVVSHYLGLPLAGFRRLRIENGSVNVLRFHSRGPQLVALNWKRSLA